MPEELVIDTCVLQKANAPISGDVRERSLLARRVRLLRAIRDRHAVALYSRKLLHEYNQHVRSPRNDFVRAFFALLADPDRSLLNWAKWQNADQELACGKCRYPPEDLHVLRTAIRPTASAIVTEEARMLLADKCIYRFFRVHIKTV